MGREHPGDMGRTWDCLGRMGASDRREVPASPCGVLRRVGERRLRGWDSYTRMAGDIS